MKTETLPTNSAAPTALASEPWLEALVQKWRERRDIRTKCATMAAQRGAYTEANTMQIQAEMVDTCLSELLEASNARDERPARKPHA